MEYGRISDSATQLEVGELRRQYEAYKDAKEGINANDLYRMGNMGKSAWRNTYGAIVEFAKKTLPSAYNLIRNPDDYTTMGIRRGYAEELLKVLGLDGKYSVEDALKTRSAANSELLAGIEALRNDATNAANEIGGMRQGYFQYDESIPNLEAARRNLEPLVEKLKGNGIEDYLNELETDTAQYGSEGRAEFDRITKSAFLVYGVIDKKSYQIKPRAVLDWFIGDDIEKVAHRVIRYVWGSKGGGKSREGNAADRSAELSKIEGTTGVAARNVISKIEAAGSFENSGVSLEQLGTSALYIDYRIWQKTMSLRQMTGNPAGLESAINGGDENEVNRFFSSITADRNRAVAEAKEIMSLRQQAKYLSEIVDSLDSQRYDQFLIGYLNVGEENSGITSSLWEGKSVVDREILRIEAKFGLGDGGSGGNLSASVAAGNGQLGSLLGALNTDVGKAYQYAVRGGAAR